MNKKIIVLSGSPRKKDGYRIIKQIENLMSNKGKVEFDYLHTNELHIKDCIGCMQCFDKGEGCCPLRDDIQKLVDRLMSCDGIILHSPVYAQHITGSMKKTIDRMSYMFHRPALIAKPAITIITTDGGGIKPTQDYLKLVGRGFGCCLLGELSIISPHYYNESSFYNPKYYKKANQSIQRLADKLYSSIHGNNKPIPSYQDLYMFYGLRSKTYFFKSDYEYWKSKGWLKSSYYYDVELSFFKKSFGRLLNGLIKLMIKKHMRNT